MTPFSSLPAAPDGGTVRRPVLLLVDGDPFAAGELAQHLGDSVEIRYARRPAEAARILAGETPAVILCDSHTPDQGGIDFLREIRTRWPQPERLLTAGDIGSTDLLAALNEAGISAFLPRPWTGPQTAELLHQAIDRFYRRQEPPLPAGPASPREREAGSPSAPAPTPGPAPGPAGSFGRLVHRPDSPLAAVVALARRVSRFDLPVLLTGESGTGKEVLARAIHDHSPRSGGPFVSENCGALPDSLLEGELFGSRKGAFTGSWEDRIGLFEQAGGGTIFLDEIGDTSPAFQVRLLRVLQEGEIRPLGARTPRPVDVRVIAATNRDLHEEVRCGRFRQDLYYRLAAFPLCLPPLRQRRQDIPLLVEALLQETSLAGHGPFRAGAAVMADLQGRHWPGNVRELRNELLRLMVMADGPELEPLPVPLPVPDPVPELEPGQEQGAAQGQQTTAEKAGDAAPASPGALDGLPLRDQVEALEYRIILDSLTRHNGNISHVASHLGLSRVGLRAKMVRHGLARDS